MTLTLLFDLDDTLLSNSMDDFVPAYMGALHKTIAPDLPLHVFAQAMLTATGEMATNQDPLRTLKDTFDPAFYPKLKLNTGDLSAEIDDFYQNTFPRLRSVTSPRPAAAHTIKTAFERGWQVAIATNPLFPRAAILERLRWAGLDPENFPFAIIPSYETFHSAKPDPAFFAELLGRFGWPRGPVVMVGNDPEQDIHAAYQLGIPTYWISNGNEYPTDLPEPVEVGDLESLIPWLDAVSPKALKPNYTSVSAVKAVLKGALSALIALAGRAPSDFWGRKSEGEDWNLTEIICHLRDVELEVNLPRVRRILSETEPFIQGKDTDAWALTRDYAAQDGPAALQDFAAARIEVLLLLNQLEPEAWLRAARHAIFGPTTLQELTGFTAGHDRLHIRQIHQQITL